jgi:hypothetical protein
MRAEKGKTEVGAVQLAVKEHQTLLKPEKARNGFSFTACRKRASVALSTLSFLPSDNGFGLLAFQTVRE